MIERSPDARRTERLARPSGVRYTHSLSAYMRQNAYIQQSVKEFFDLTTLEIQCWRAFGIEVDWYMDELVIRAPHG